MGAELEGYQEWANLLGGLENADALVVDHLTNVEAPKLFAALHSRGSRFGRMGAHAVGTLQIHHVDDGAVITAGGYGGGLGAVLFAGTEYGGRVRRKTYASTSSRGKSFLVKQRRTTMMFGPHLAAGYWFWPAVRVETMGIVGRCRDVITKAVNGG